MLVDNRIAIAELRGDIHLDEDARHLLDVVFSDETRVVSRAAGDDVNLIERIEIRGIPSEFLEGNRLLVRGDALTHRITHRLWLLVDLLEHEMLIAALLRSLGIPRDLEDLLRDGRAQMIRHLDCILAHNGKLAIGKDVGAARLGDDRGDIRGDEVLALAKPDDERVVLLRTEQHIRMLPAHERKRVRSFDPLKHRAHGGDEVPAVDLLE